MAASEDIEITTCHESSRGDLMRLRAIHLGVFEDIDLGYPSGTTGDSTNI